MDGVIYIKRKEKNSIQNMRTSRHEMRTKTQKKRWRSPGKWEGQRRRWRRWRSGDGKRSRWGKVRWLTKERERECCKSCCKLKKKTRRGWLLWWGQSELQINGIDAAASDQNQFRVASARRFVITERWDGKEVKSAEQSRAHCTLRINGNAAGGLEDCRRLTCLICRRRHLGDPRLEKGGNLAKGRSGVLIQWPALQHQVVDLRGTGGRPLQGQAVGEAGGVEARGIGIALLLGTLLVSTVGAAARAAGTVRDARRSVRRLVVDGTGLLGRRKNRKNGLILCVTMLCCDWFCDAQIKMLSLRYLFSVSWKRHSKKPINLLLRKSSKKLQLAIDNGDLKASAD